MAIQLNTKSHLREVTSVEELIITEDDSQVTFSSGDFKVVVSKSMGTLISYQVNRVEMLEGPMVPTFWRAPTDNDFGNRLQQRAKIWKDVMDNAKVAKVVVNKDDAVSASLEVSIKLPNVEGQVDLVYEVSSSGQIDVSYSFYTKKNDLPEIPRIGMKTQLNKAMSKLSYYGRGPWENYIDRNTAALIGTYNSEVKNQYFAYARPQENGHKTDVRWLSLVNQGGYGIQIQSINEPIEFNALPYETSDLDPGEKKMLRTPLDLQERDFVELHIDHKMMGVGGDNSWGAKPHASYMFYADKKYTYQFRIKPIQ